MIVAAVRQQLRRAEHDAAVTADRAVRQRRGLRVEREHSFVDATSYAVMRRLGLSEALGFDGDCAAAGFVELRPG